MIISDRLATIAGIILVVVMPIVLVVSPLCTFVTPSFVRHEYSQRGFPPAGRFGGDERLRLSDTILHYLRGKRARDALATMRTEGGEFALTAGEVEHLADVKAVMWGIFFTYAVAVVTEIVCLALLWRSSQRHLLPARLRQGVWLTAALIGLVAISSLIDFEVFFTRFHQVFFPPNTWVFDPSDTLIQLYPLPFWVDAVYKIAAVTCFELVLVYALSLALGRAARPLEPPTIAN